jgi:hypothetical protein
MAVIAGHSDLTLLKVNVLLIHVIEVKSRNVDLVEAEVPVELHLTATNINVGVRRTTTRIGIRRSSALATEN